MTITAIIPAYNEFEELPRAVASLRAQSLPPDQIIIALNNAKPGLFGAAVATGASVIDLGRCPNLKAEALNRLIAEILPQMHDDDLLLVADADGTLASTWIETAAGLMGPAVVVGGVFLGQSGGGWLGKAQRNEYLSYAREVFARRDKAWVLTGTGTMFRADQARAVLERRDRLYDEQVSTEDFELTVTFRELGFRCLSPKGCEVTTEVMSSLRSLHDQRVRWYRGAVETLRLHGISRVTAPYLWQQAKILTGFLLSWVAMALTLILALAGQLTWSWWWVIALIPVASRVVGGQHKWFAATVLPELVYDLLLQRSLAAGWWRALTSKGRVWNAAEGM